MGSLDLLDCRKLPGMAVLHDTEAAVDFSIRMALAAAR